MRISRIGSYVDRKLFEALPQGAIYRWQDGVFMKTDVLIGIEGQLVNSVRLPDGALWNTGPEAVVLVIDDITLVEE